MTIPILKVGDISYFEVDGPSLSEDEEGQFRKFAITTETLQGLGKRRQLSAIAQLYGLVIPGLILSSHLFQGLNRYLYCDGTPDGDDEKFVFSRKPAYDYFWNGGSSGHEVKQLAPSGQVLVVIVSKNIKHKETFSDIEGWIDHWNWVDEDPVLQEAPVNWVDRYNKKIWSRDK